MISSAPSRSGREERAQNVRENVLDAAIAVFAEKGFEGATLGEISRRSSVKQPLIVYHFNSKQELWEAAAGALVVQFDQRQRVYFAEQPSGGDTQLLRALLISFIRALRDLPAYGKLLLREGSTVSSRVLWLDHNFVPKIYRDAHFANPSLQQAFKTVSLLGYAVAGAVLFIVTAGPQLAVSAAEADNQAVAAEELYPLSESMVESLADMLCDLVYNQLGIVPASA